MLFNMHFFMHFICALATCLLCVRNTFSLCCWLVDCCGLRLRGERKRNIAVGHLVTNPLLQIRYDLATWSIHLLRAPYDLATISLWCKYVFATILLRSLYDLCSCYVSDICYCYMTCNRSHYTIGITLLVDCCGVMLRVRMTENGVYIWHDFHVIAAF